MDRLVIPAVVARRDCSTCHHSWNLPPSYREAKEGAVEVLTFCLHEGCRIRMSDGVYPRLTKIARARNGLCGYEGRWWTPIVEPVQVGGVPPTKRATTEYHRPRADQSTSRPPRTPYKLSASAKEKA